MAVALVRASRIGEARCQKAFSVLHLLRIFILGDMIMVELGEWLTVFWINSKPS